jgi:hypothetical protein
VGETLVTASASGTAFLLTALPIPQTIQISRNLQVIDEEDKKLLALQTEIIEESERNRKFIENMMEQHYSLTTTSEEGVSKNAGENGGSDNGSDSDGDSSESSISDDEDYKAKVVVQVDDDADEDVIAVLLEPPLIEGFQFCNVETIPRSWMENNCDRLISQQNIVLIKSGQIVQAHHHPNRQLVGIFHDLIFDLMYSLLHFQICLVSGMNYEIQLPRENEVRIVLNASVMGFVESPKPMIALSSTSDVFMELSKKGSVTSNDRITVEAPLSATASNASKSFPFARHNAGAGLLSYNGSIQEIIQDAVENNSETGASTHGMERIIRERLMSEASTIPPEEGKEEDKDDASEPVSSSGEYDDDGGAEDGRNHQAGVDESETEEESSNNRKEISSSEDATNTQKLVTTPSFDLLSTTTRLFAASAGCSNHVEITPLPFIAGGRIEAHLGHICLNFVKEDTNVNESSGGISSFINAFLLEVQAVVRAHVISLGGNALVSFQLNQSIIQERLKNHGYGLISITGDVILVAFEREYSNSWHSISRQNFQHTAVSK